MYCEGGEHTRRQLQSTGWSTTKNTAKSTNNTQVRRKRAYGLTDSGDQRSWTTTIRTTRYFRHDTRQDTAAGRYTRMMGGDGISR